MVEQAVGHTSWNRPTTPYEQFCDEQGVPVYRGLVGVYDSRELTLAPWKRMGGNGCIVDLDGTGGLLGMYVIEIPGGGALNAEKHLYEEVFYVLEGRGTTEIWVDDNPKRQSFEWQADSVFTAPLNTWHQLVNASSSPALILVGTNAPPVMELFRNEDFVFNTPYHFEDRYNLNDDFFKPWDELGTETLSGRAINMGAIVPDAAHCELPLDGQRGAGHRHFFLRMGGNFFNGFIAQYAGGRYSKSHAHDPGPVLVCLNGSGYSITWDKALGTTPWENGYGDQVKRQDYKAGGFVSAVPGGAQAFHGHFGSSKDPFRVMAFLGGYPVRTQGKPGDEIIGINRDIKQGGNTIEYRDEDPYVRKMFEEALTKNGATFTMPEEVYVK
jgi:mannose-6-phosphate isomerase-like protein (cupin superfamily)